MIRDEVRDCGDGAGLWGFDRRPAPSSSGMGREGITSVIVNHLKLLVGGGQLRDGVVTVSDILGRIFTRAGRHVLAMERGDARTIYGAHQYDPMVVAEEPPVTWGAPAIDIGGGLAHDSNPDAKDWPAG